MKHNEKGLFILHRWVLEVELGLCFLKIITSVNSNQKFEQYKLMLIRLSWTLALLLTEFFFFWFLMIGSVHDLKN